MLGHISRRIEEKRSNRSYFFFFVTVLEQYENVFRRLKKCKKKKKYIYKISICTRSFFFDSKCFTRVSFIQTFIPIKTGQWSGRSTSGTRQSGTGYFIMLYEIPEG